MKDAGASVSLTPVRDNLAKKCRRAYVTLSGGNNDIPVRGEDVLFDFSTNQIVARDLGNPGPEYEEYGGGVDMPLFCNVVDLAKYSQRLLEPLIDVDDVVTFEDSMNTNDDPEVSLRR